MLQLLPSFCDGSVECLLAVLEISGEHGDAMEERLLGAFGASGTSGKVDGTEDRRFTGFAM